MFLGLQHFEGYDPEGFSMWMCDYKYNDENTVNYVVMNKVSPICTSCCWNLSHVAAGCGNLL